jgi:hypothetical protein
MTILVLDRLAIGCGAAAAGLTFAPAFDRAAGMVLVVVATAVVVATVLPRGWWATPFVATGPALAVLVGRQPLPAWRLLVEGPGQATDLTLPLPSELVIVPALLTGLAAVAGSILVRRRPGGLEALLPAAVTGGYGIVAAGLHSPQTLPACLGLGAAGLLLVRSRRRAAVLAALAAGTPLFWLPQHAPPGAADPRDRRQPATRAAAGVDLIDQVGGWLAAPAEQVLFTVDVGPVTGWRLAVLDVYDGETWRPSGRIVPAGLGVPPHRGPVPADAITRRVRLDRLTGPYLPAADRPIRVTAPVDAVEPDSGVLLTSRRPVAGLGYEVVSRPHPDRKPAPDEPAGRGDAAIPDDLRRPVQDFLTRTAVRPGMPPALRAETVRRFLRTQRRNLTGGPSSATVPALRALLQDGGTGTPVQFATAFALAMRADRIPARLVIGFDAPGSTVHAHDVRVWTEVEYEQAGWVRYDPAPPPTRADAAPPRPAAPEPVAPSAEPSPSTAPISRPTGSAGGERLHLLLLAGVGCAALFLLAPAARRAWRRRKRRNPDARVAAAWHDVLDAWAPADRRALTPALLHARLSTRLPPPAVADSLILQRLAAQALYSSEPCSPGDGDRAWSSATALRKALRLSRRPAGRNRAR